MTAFDILPSPLCPCIGLMNEQPAHVASMKMSMWDLASDLIKMPEASILKAVNSEE